MFRKTFRGNESIPAKKPVFYKGERRGSKELRGVHLLQGRSPGGTILELLHPPELRGEEIIVEPARVSTDIFPENRARLKELLGQSTATE